MSQGHHRDSALLYSWNDTFSSLLVQSAICTIADGFSPRAQRAGKRRASTIAQTPVFGTRIAPRARTDGLARALALFSPHGMSNSTLHQTRAASQSDDEAAESSEPVLWVCNGPWSALRRVTNESAANYSAEGSADASLPKPRCGCKIGVAALAIISSHPCRRKRLLRLPYRNQGPLLTVFAIACSLLGCCSTDVTCICPPPQTF